MQIKYLPHANYRSGKPDPRGPASYEGGLSRSTEGAAGYDLRACSYSGPQAIDPLRTWGVMAVQPGEVIAFGTGVALSMATCSAEEGICGMIVPRSGIGSRGLVLANGTGIIDSDYHGEVIVKLRNVSNGPFMVRAFDRIAQILFVPVFFPAWEVVEEFAHATERGAAGFGSTGVA
jgi:dUTP pyrophosphatase